MALLGVEFPRPVLFHFRSVRSTTAQRVGVLSTAAGAGSAHDTGYTTALPPPFNGVLHTGHWSALPNMGSRTVGLTAVGSAGGDGQFDQILSGFAFKDGWEGHFFAF